MIATQDHTASPDASSRPAGRQAGRRAAFLLPLLLAAACILGGQAFLFRHDVPHVLSDGNGYWSYLPSYLIFKDPTFAAFMALYADTPQAQGVRQTSDGTYLQKYGIGVAVLQSPFFLAADAVARSARFERDGYSPPYQVAAALAPAVYALLGLGLLLRAFRPYYPAASLAWAAAFLFLGTNAYHYATFDGSFSHIFSFFLGSALLCLLLGWRQRSLALALATGLVLGLMLLVRPTNAQYFLFAACWLGLDRYRAGGRAGLRRAALELAVCGLVAGAVFSLQLAAWHASTGKWLVYAYDGEYFEFFSPHLRETLFSVRKGLFFWHPMYLVAILGLFLVRRSPGYLPAAAAFLAVFTYVTASWYCWWYGGTLGQRAFVDALPVLFPGLANLTVLPSRAARLGAIGLGVVLTLYALFCTWFYWVGVIPPDEATGQHLRLAWRILRVWLLAGLGPMN
ncbi:hypothetical protein DFW101_0359 [Solidesulfovibrio carbinoliphilus subsp. oakridgensis]|uniref:Glycosyltransferase RgtA/B/C/D-like domain-containing protein n=1 Tax=Solidesulfovibrio carbinoliphilus subsp. oakridgensis TaxID=694327 RepID=G7QD70_9BACT|nr:hypothetical protein [Solidesulfovibrio carbinoliphilus]EHJ46376.1 hypothetical protein DFW101_0359 [Solidesulfovibrio carbinoliphilus subsp. oakridgensis]